MLKVRTLAILVGWLCSSLVQAASEQQVRERLLQLQPDMGIESISAVAQRDLYQVGLSGGSFIYVDADVSFLMAGELYTIAANGEATNETDIARQAMNKAVLSTLDPAGMIIFPAENKQASITVFTDVDCGYCRKLHQEVPALNKAGIEVRYLAWPRQGLAGQTYDQMVSLWCADDTRQAMTQAKAGHRLKISSCKNPVDRHYALGQQLGLRGTPAIVLDNGTIIPGYVPAEQLAARAVAAQ